MNDDSSRAPFFFRGQRGVTLVELMIASLLSLLLIAGVIQIFLGTRQTYRFLDAMSRLQENGRFAMSVMSADIRMANLRVPANLANLADAIADDGNGFTVRWIDGGATATPTADCSGIANCSLRRYFIQARTAGGTAPSCAAAGNSLFLRRDNATAQELLEGVQALQILYGECGDANNDGTLDTPPLNYVAAAAVTDWSRVCAIRVYLLLVSLEDNVVEQAQGYFFPPDSDTMTTAQDRCLHQAFSTTVALRNRMPRCN